MTVLAVGRQRAEQVEPILLTENGQSIERILATHQAETLSASDVVTLTPAYTANAWTIAPGRLVGVARVGDVEV